MNKDPILIFGADRSGTSMVANMVEKWGAYGGASLERNGDIRNPKGYYENIYLQTLIGRHLDCVFQNNYESVLEQKRCSMNVCQEFQKFIDEMQSTDRIWFIKEPLIGVMLPFFRIFFENPVCVVTVRNPYESALSWQKFLLRENNDYTVLSANILRWQYIMSTSLKNIKAMRKIFLSYEGIHSDPDESVKKLAGFLDNCYGVSSNQNTIGAMVSVVNNDLYRNKSDVPFEDCDSTSVAQQDLYRTLVELLDDPEKVIEGDFPLPVGWDEYITNAENLCRLARNVNRKKWPSLFNWIR